MTERFVLPSLVPDDDYLGSETIFANWRNRASSTPYLSERDMEALRASPSLSNGVNRSGSRLCNGPPPSAYRPPRSDASHSDASAYHNIGSPRITKRASSLLLKTKSLPRTPSSDALKALPQTPISATPSLTFSESRTDSRSDDDGLLFSPVQHPVMKRLSRRYAGLDLEESLDVLDQLDRSQPELVRMRLRSSSLSKYAGRKLAAADSMRMSIDADSSFLPCLDDELSAPAVYLPPAPARKATIAFKQRTQRHPDKVAHLLGEEYEREQRAILQGEATEKAGISPRKASFRALFPFKAIMKKERDNIHVDESEWEKEIRLEEKRRKKEEKEREAQAKVLDLVSEFSLDRHFSSGKGKVRSIGASSMTSSTASSPDETIRGSKTSARRAAVPASPRNNSDSQTSRSRLARPDMPQRQATDYGRREHKSQNSNDSSTLVSSIGHRRLRRPNTSGSSTDHVSFLPSPGDDSSGTSQAHGSNRAPSEQSEGWSDCPPSQSSQPASRSQAIKKSRSIDALFAMLDPWTIQQNEGLHRIADDRVSQRSGSLVDRRSKGKERQLDLAVQSLFGDGFKPSPQQSRASDHDYEIAQSVSKRSFLALPTAHGPDLDPKQTDDQTTSIPLSAQVDYCLGLNRRERIEPWGEAKTRSKLLSAFSRGDMLPKSWAAYVCSYAQGDFDISDPPAPLTMPLVDQACTSALSKSPSMKSVLCGSPSYQPSFQTAGMTSKESLQSLNTYFDTRDSLNSSPPTSERALTPAASPSRRPHHPYLAQWNSPSRVGDRGQEASKSASDEEEDERSQTEQLSAVGGMGDIRAPRPPWEAERVVSAEDYIELCADRFQPKLALLVERLARQLETGHASIQLLSRDVCTVLASYDMFEAFHRGSDIPATPRQDSHPAARSVSIGLLCRESSLDAHTILQRDGLPVTIADLGEDWRFEKRKSLSMPFYAGVSIFASDTGLPIGTVSVTHHKSKLLNDEDILYLREAAREVERELERVRRQAMQERLKEMDEGITAWMSLSKRQVDDKAAILPTPILGSISAGCDSLLEAGSSIAMTAPSMLSTNPHLHVRLSSALDTILNDLRLDIAYIARVRSAPLTCTVEMQRIASGNNNLLQLQPDAAMHLCALAALRRGLEFEDDEGQVLRLLFNGEEGVEGSSSSPAFTSAIIVACGMKAESRMKRGTEGWVLGVASRCKHRLGAESSVYLSKFSALLAPLLLQAQQAHLNKQARHMSPPLVEPTMETTTIARTSQAILQRSDSLSSSKRLTPLPKTNRKRPPLSSPPPTAPLPLLPAGVIRSRRVSDLRSIGSSRSSVSHNEGLEVLDSDDGHFSHHRWSPTEVQPSIVQS